MTNDNKESAKAIISRLGVSGGTNISCGLFAGLDEMNKISEKKKNCGRYGYDGW